MFPVVVVAVKFYLFWVKSEAKSLLATEQSYTTHIYTHIHLTNDIIARKVEIVFDYIISKNRSVPAVI